MDNLSRYISDSDCYRTSTQLPKVAACEDWGHHIALSKTVLSQERENQSQTDKQQINWSVYVSPADSQKQTTHTHGNTHIVTVLPNWSFCLFSRKHDRIWVHLPLKTPASKLFYVKRINKRMCERQFGKIMENMAIFIDHNVYHHN